MKGVFIFTLSPHAFIPHGCNNKIYHCQHHHHHPRIEMVRDWSQVVAAKRDKFERCYDRIRSSLIAHLIKNLSAMQETWVRLPAWEDPLEKEMATHSSILAWRIPRTEEPGRLQSMMSQRVGHDLVTKERERDDRIMCRLREKVNARGKRREDLEMAMWDPE